MPVTVREIRLDPKTFRDRLRSYCNIISALVLHDIKNRFFGSGLGQIVMVVWPFVHIVFLILLYYFTGRMNPYGTSLVQYTSVSVFPFICFNYVSRWVAWSAMTNKTFLQYPIIKPLDLIIARVILEIVSINIVAILLIFLVEALGDSALPYRTADAVYAFLATIFLAVSIAIPNAVIVFRLPLWNVVVTLLIIVSWAASGALFVVSKLPQQIREPLSYNPLLQCTEWFRVAYYNDYPTTVLDRSYVLKFSLVCFTIGLISERIFRRRLY